MRCGRARRYISDYVDGALAPELMDLLRRHTDKCAECRQLLQDFQAMACEAKGLERLTPSDDAWLKIRASLHDAKTRRVESERAERERGDSARRRLFRPAFSRLSFVPAMATVVATVIVVAAVGILYLEPWHTAVSADKVAVDSFTLAKLDEAEKHYEEAVRALNEAMAIQLGTLDPDVTRVFETNLAVVDGSIETCRQAVRRDPRDMMVQYALLDSYKEKIQLMTEFISTRRASGQEESPVVTP